MILTRSSLYRGLHWGACAILVMLWLGTLGQQVFSPAGYPGLLFPGVMTLGLVILGWCVVDAVRTAERPWALRVAVVFALGCAVLQWWGDYPPVAPAALPALIILASWSYGVAGFAFAPLGGAIVSVLASGLIFLSRQHVLGTAEAALTVIPNLTTGALAALAIAIMSRAAGKVEHALGQVWQEREAQARARSMAAASVRWDGLIHDKVLGALRLASRARTAADRAGAAELAGEAITVLRAVGPTAPGAPAAPGVPAAAGVPTAAGVPAAAGEQVAPGGPAALAGSAPLGQLSDAPAVLALVTDDRLAENLGKLGALHGFDGLHGLDVLDGGLGAPDGPDEMAVINAPAGSDLGGRASSPERADEFGWAGPAWFEAQLRRHAARLGLQLHWDVRSDGATAILPASQARAVLDAAAEALTNVARHAGQATAILTGELAAGRLRLQITDTGTGFDPATVPAGRAGVSRGILARITVAGGTARVHSRPGRGTTVEIDVAAATPRGSLATTLTWNPGDFVAIFAIAAIGLIDYAALALVHADAARSLPVLGACLMFAYLLGTVATFTPVRFAPAAYVAGLGCGLLAFVSTVNLVDPGAIGWHYWFVGITNPTIAALMFRFPSRWAFATVASVVTGLVLGQVVSGQVHLGVLVDVSPQLVAFAMASWGIRTALDGATAYLNTAAAGLGRLRVATAALEEADRVAISRSRQLGSRVDAMLRRIAAAEELDAADAARCIGLEAATRDVLVARSLVSPAVAAAVQVCRARGTIVVLSAEEPPHDEALRGRTVGEQVGEQLEAQLEAFRRLLIAALDVAAPQARVLARWRPGRARRLGSISIVGSVTVDQAAVQEIVAGAHDGGSLDVDLSVDEDAVLVDVRTPRGNGVPEPDVGGDD